MQRLPPVELVRAVRPDRLSSATRQCGLSAASSAQRPPARQLRHPISADRARPIGREVLRPPEVRSEPRRPSEEAQRGQSGCTWGCLIHEAAVVGRFFLARAQREKTITLLCSCLLRKSFFCIPCFRAQRQEDFYLLYGICTGKFFMAPRFFAPSAKKKLI